MLKNKILLIINKNHLFKAILFAVAVLFFEACTVLDEKVPVGKKNVLNITAKSSLVWGESGEITFTFSEEVSGFTTNSIELSGVEVTKKGKFTTVSKKKYTWEITPEEIGKLYINIPIKSFKDSSGNFNAYSISKKFLIYKSSGEKFSLKEIVVDLGVIPDDMSRVDELSKDVLSYYNSAYLPEVVARYVKAGVTGDGSSWDKVAGSPKDIIDGITDDSDKKIYLVLVASGEYPSDNLAMKNHVAIVGGWDSGLKDEDSNWERAGVTRFDGQGKNRVFHNNNLDRTALLYGVTIANGNNANDGGAGMVNVNSSPTLKIVTFTGNKTRHNGGGMYNKGNSSPSLENVIFSNNIAENNGGGMDNTDNSNPILRNVVFLNNTAKKNGAGMGNTGNSNPTLNKVTFSGNTAVTYGGGMYNNDNSNPSLVEVVFLSNTSSDDGGGMYNGKSSPILEKVTFIGNETENSGGGMLNESYSSPNLEKVTFIGNKSKANGGGGML